MKIGFIGLGKLGMPVAVCVAAAGHSVVGYDQNPERMRKNEYPFKEEGRNSSETFQDMISNSTLTFASSVAEVVAESDLIFIAIQTPHAQEFEGITRVPDTTQDFDYTYLVNCLNELTALVTTPKTIAIISTVAPGTYEKHLDAILRQNTNIRYCYNPFFIAMGTVVKDFLNPEFVLIGSHDKVIVDDLMKFYATIHSKPVISMSVASAEVTKMSYNTIIGLKIAFANSAMELCEAFGGDVDDVMGALKKAHDRIISPKYLTAGMGDGGGCHPRDNIVLSHLAKTHNLSCDMPGMMMKARELQTEWIANHAIKHSLKSGLPIAVLGRAFKPETNIETGSPAVLCINLLKEKGFEVLNYEPFNDEKPIEEPCVFIIGCKHQIFKDMKFPTGSIIIDPHRYVEPQSGVVIHKLGANRESIS